MITRELISFTWKCCNDGYVWRRKTLVSSSLSCETYAPPSDLFLIFAQTKPTREGILAFALVYGLLGSETATASVPRYPLALARGLGIRRPRMIREVGEPLASWVGEIQDMKRVVNLYLRRKQEQFWNAVNYKLQDTVAPRFSAKGELTLTPKNLLGFLWLQLGLKSRGKWVIRECRVCREPMVIREMGARPSRLTDSSSCRVTLSNLRTAYRDGSKSLTEIARRLQVRRRTAQAWLEEPVSKTGKAAKRTLRQ